MTFLSLLTNELTYQHSPHFLYIYMLTDTKQGKYNIICINKTKLKYKK